MAIDKPLSDISPDDLQRLVANQVSESRSLEYKQALPGRADADKREFLADVSAFANAVGGDLLYGVTEVRDEGKPTGLAESIDGLPDVNTGEQTLWLENVLRDGIQPRLQGVQFRWVPVPDKGPVLIIRIPRSWTGPHMVTFQQLSRFHSRNASGKYQLDVFELRQAFLGRGAIADRVREFRAERLGRLVAGDTPVPLHGKQLVCVHVIPHVAVADSIDLDLLSVINNQRDYLQPLFAENHGWHNTFNLDGLLTNWPAGDGPTLSYLQVHRNGILEAVTSGLLAERDHGPGVAIYATSFAQEHLGPFLNRARALMKRLDIPPPASLYVSLLGAEGASLVVTERMAIPRRPQQFDRDLLLLRELSLPDWEGDVMTVLKPLLNELWQAAGHARCFDYGDDGNWRPR